SLPLLLISTPGFLLTCSLLLDVPVLLKYTHYIHLSHEGTCSEFVLLWFFHLRSGECRPFVYGGCGGNGNRFSSRQECQSWCAMERSDKARLGFQPMSRVTLLTRARITSRAIRTKCRND
uniref:BPTI/Kunitz inhibitor domain-containing protein n=1 Tax=Mola mola TaxID=94237 RepID=A0A3Q4AF79_MOLML